MNLARPFANGLTRSI